MVLRPKLAKAEPHRQGRIEHAAAGGPAQSHVQLVCVARRVEYLEAQRPYLQLVAILQFQVWEGAGIGLQAK